MSQRSAYMKLSDVRIAHGRTVNELKLASGCMCHRYDKYHLAFSVEYGLRRLGYLRIFEDAFEAECVESVARERGCKLALISDLFALIETSRFPLLPLTCLGSRVGENGSTLVPHLFLNCGIPEVGIVSCGDFSEEDCFLVVE